MTRRRAGTIWLLFVVVALVSLLIALGLGSATHSPFDAWLALVSPEHPSHQAVLQLRLPRVVAGFVVGALLAQAGCLLQVLLRNPLAEPYVLGVSGGAALAALVALSLAAGSALTSAASALGATLSLVVLMTVARHEFAARALTYASERLLLAGVMLAAMWGALMTLALSLASAARLQSLVFWLMGDLSGAAASWPAWLALAVVTALAQFDAAALNLLARGEEQAYALGVSTWTLKRRAVLLAAVASGAAVSVAGTVGFVGLLAPHVVRRIAGNDQRIVLPLAALLGGSFVVLCDGLARSVLAPRQLPVGALTALIGAPVFLVLMQKRRSWSSN
jgi:iron complex transport system permease protein